MAFILGIYEELIKTIRSFDTGFVKLIFGFKIQAALEYVNWRFLLPLILGILAAIFSLARLLSWVLENHPVLIWSFFFGLILASVFTVSKHLHRWTPTLIAWMLIGAAGIYLLVGLVPVETPTAPWFLVISGAVAICAMILPGISGSFILPWRGSSRNALAPISFISALSSLGSSILPVGPTPILNVLPATYSTASFFDLDPARPVRVTFTDCIVARTVVTP